MARIKTLKQAAKELKSWEHSGDERLGQAIRFILGYVFAIELLKKKRKNKPGVGE